MPSEDKNQRFRRLAEKRTNVILDKMRILSNLSNPGLYKYTDFEVKKMFDAVEDALRVAKARFRKGEREEKDKFTF